MAGRARSAVARCSDVLPGTRREAGQARLRSICCRAGGWPGATRADAVLPSGRYSHGPEASRGTSLPRMWRASAATDCGTPSAAVVLDRRPMVGAAKAVRRVARTGLARALVARGQGERRRPRRARRPLGSPVGGMPGAVPDLLGGLLTCVVPDFAPGVASRPPCGGVTRGAHGYRYARQGRRDDHPTTWPDTGHGRGMDAPSTGPACARTLGPILGEPRGSCHGTPAARVTGESRGPRPRTRPDTPPDTPGVPGTAGHGHHGCPRAVPFSAGGGRAGRFSGRIWLRRTGT